MNVLYNTKINKYLELAVAMRNLWCLEKISILPLIISATGIVPQSLFKNLKILDLGNTLVVEIQNSSLFDEFVCKLGLFWHAWAILNASERVEYNVFLFDEPLKGYKLLKTFKISLTFRFDKL
jgi:hypothetical protein